ncbi:lytic transglycosylase, partial [Xanthomonas oryzae pv. oryzae]
MPLAHFCLRPWPVLVVVALMSVVPAAHALSKRDTEKAAALDARMAAAEKRYRDALVLVNNSDPKGTAEGDAALEDMEDIIDACIKQRGCLVSNQLATYKRLLKTRADAEAPAAEDPEDDDTLLQADPDHLGPASNGIPEAARAATLLNDQRHDFDKMVQYNPAVQAGIRRWLTDMRPALLTSYENYSNLRGVMWPEWQKRGLPEALLFGIMAKESNGKVHASSRAGAAGLM